MKKIKNGENLFVVSSDKNVVDLSEIITFTKLKKIKNGENLTL